MRVSKMALMATALSMLAGCADPGHDRPASDERLSGRDSLWHPEQIVSGRPYYCGDTPVVFNTQGPHEHIIVAGTAFNLKPVVSASGARYESLDGTDTGIWSKGDRARVTVRGVDLPKCRAVAAPELPFTARGQEPGWMITIDDDTILLNADYGTLQQRFPRPESQVSAHGAVYRTTAAGRRLTVFIQPRICADVATGMPHPYRVRYDLDGAGHTGCGGDPKSLLTGQEWRVESIGDQPVIAGSSVTIEFLEGDRVAGSASCNRFMGGYRLTGEGLTFDQMAGSMMACEEPLSRQEARFLGLLQDTVRFEIDPSGRLLLHTKSGQNIGARR